MNDTLTDILSVAPRLSWLTGPIFDKELRVSSRRRRNFAMRSLYISLLTIFIAFVWIREVSHGYWGGAFAASRMAEAGKYVIEGIVSFQFFAIQVLAVIMLSGSISDEIDRRTLHVLMSTPISSFQIVMGKLLSKLLQLIILLGISLPLLGIVRVFGGVPWTFLVSSLCVTVTAAVLVGSISLFFSIFCRRFYIAIVITMLVVAAVYFLVPLFVEETFGRPTYNMLCHLNPFLMMTFMAKKMLNPGMPWVMPRSWAVHCVLMLCISAAVLFVSARFVRKAALRQAAGKLGFFGRLFMRFEEWSAQRDSLRGRDAAIRRVRGPAVIWKELIRPVSRRQRLTAAIIIGAEVIMIMVAYTFPALMAAFGHPDAVMLNVWILMGMGILFTTILPATSITSEKEARSWPLLLGTTSNGWQILLGKFAGVLRRCLLIWIMLLFYFVMFWRIGTFHPLAIGQIAMVITGTVVFLCGAGFYFSSRFRRTNNAVIGAFALIAAVWFFVPLLVLLITEAFGAGGLAEAYLAAIPFGQAVIVVSMTGDGIMGSSMYWMDSGQYWLGRSLHEYESTFAIFATMLGYMSVGLLFAWRAKCRFWRDVF